MTATPSPSLVMPSIPSSPGFWRRAWQRFRDDRVGMASLLIVALFLLLVLLAALGVVAANWNEEAAVYDAPPDFWGLATPARNDSVLGDASQRAARPVSEKNSALPPLTVIDPLADDIARLQGNGSVAAKTDGAPFWQSAVTDPLAPVLQSLRTEVEAPAHIASKRDSLPLGGDRWGRDVLKKVMKGSQTSILVGLIAALLATALGTLFGALAGYYGGHTDDVLNWVYSVFNAIPYLLLILAVAAVLQQRGVVTVILILGLTGWTGVFRLIRAEYIKHRERDYVRAAHAFGVPERRILFAHILPNVSHVVLVEMSILVVGFIKAEVILSFLGFGVGVDEVSWGSMLNDAQSELILGKWWELMAATVAMALLVTAFSLFTDAMRDALDPRTQGSAQNGVA